MVSEVGNTACCAAVALAKAALYAALAGPEIVERSAVEFQPTIS